MNKTTRMLWVVVSLLFNLSIIPAQSWADVPPEYDVCRDTGIVFAFFNGVQTTFTEAARASEEFKAIHGQDGPDGEQIRYEVMYNYTDGFDDFVETFEQRVLEQESLLEGRFELFFEVIQGEGAWWDKLAEVVPTINSIRDDFLEWYQAKLVSSLASLAGDPPTLDNYDEHRSRIDTWIVEGKQMLFVAHSQGNLFANSAYDYTTSRSSEESVNLVHIAPASPVTNGPHTLADLDLVINGLRVVGSVPDVTHTIPGYLLRPAGINGQKDLLGHGLLEIYYNPLLDISGSVRAQIENGLETLTPPELDGAAVTGFFTVTLTWNGSGDVDLHVYEPGGSHVYYSDMEGLSGYLDVDNTVANGPEHYYASCDSRELDIGRYQIAVANYDEATGRTATLQIATVADGVIGTRSVTLGAETGDNPAYFLFDLDISQSEETGRYTARLR